MPRETTEPIELPAELVALARARKATCTQPATAASIPTVRPLVRAWGFDGDAPRVPPRRPSTRRARVVGLDKLELLDATHVRKAVAGRSRSTWRASARATRPGGSPQLLEQHGSAAYLAEIGGEIVARGAKPDGSPWRIGVENPVDGATAGPALRMPPAARTAVITSGSYRHYLEADGRRFGHIIDPRTGWPVEHALLSVTVVGADAATAAAWGTALLCLGPDAAAATAERENLAALLLDRARRRAATLEQAAARSRPSGGASCDEPRGR